MTVINQRPLKVSDENGRVVYVHDGGTAASPRVALGFSLAEKDAVVSVAASLSLVDAIRVRDELNRLIKAHGRA